MIFTPTFLFIIIFFIFGLIIGSFLNVVIIRYNTHKSFGGRSACMSCQNTLCWYELIPLFSFFALQGRCRTCKTKISAIYPAVELATGLIFAALFLKFSALGGSASGGQDMFYPSILIFSITYIYYTFIFSLLLVIAVYDLRHKIIPDPLVLFFNLVAFITLFFFTNFIFSPHVPNIIEFMSGILIASPFAFIWFVSRGTWMGLGDAKLALGLGWLLGLSLALSGLVLAFYFGAIFGLLLLTLTKKYGMKSEIPFAPFLVLGAFLAFIFNFHLFPF